MATPPTRVLYATPATNWGTGTSKTTTSFNVQAGDILVVMCSAEHAGSLTTVTPSASGGSVTWTSRASQTAGTTNQGAAYCWTGAVGATATGITITLARPSSASIEWGFTATLVRNHGGVGVAFSGNNTTGSGAPSVAATCSANSLVVCQVNDWNASDGTTRTWRTINGAPESESAYFRNASTYTVYGGFRSDTGAAGSVTQGLTAPSAMRWKLVGVEILGTASSGADHALAGTVAAATTSAGAVAARVALAGAVAATTAVVGAIGATQGLGGTVAATSAASGAVTVDHPLGGTVAAITAANGSPGTQQSLTGSVAATSTTAGTPTLRAPLAGSVAATTAVIGAPTSRQGLAGTVNAFSSTAGTFFEAGAQTYPLAGNVTATTATAGSITARHPLAGTVSAASTAVGAIRLAASLAGMVEGVTVVLGNVAATVTLSGQVAATSGASGAFEQPASEFTGRILSATLAIPTALGSIAVMSSAGDVVSHRASGRLSILRARGVIA